MPTGRTRRYLIRPFLTIALVVFLIDQASKPLAVYFLGRGAERDLGQFFARYFSLFWQFPYRGGGETVPILGRYVQLNCTTNDGMAWGLLKGHPLELSLVSLALCILIWWLWRTFGSRGLYLTVSLGLIMGGAVGNLVDRFRLKLVVDFIDTFIPLINYDFPIFNVADACASVGTMMIAGYLIWLDVKHLQRGRLLRRADLTRYYP